MRSIVEWREQKKILYFLSAILASLILCWITPRSWSLIRYQNSVKGTNSLKEQAESERLPLTPEQAIKRRQLSDPQLSPGKNLLALVMSEPVKGTEQKRNIWIYNLQNRELRHFTNSEKIDTHPRWSPDGKTLAFLSNREDRTQIYLIPISGGEARALTQSKTSVQSFAWTPDAKEIVFLANSPKLEEEEKKEKDKDDARVVDKDDKHPQLWTIDVESHKTKQITQEGWSISEFALLPQEGQLIVSGTDEQQPELFADKLYLLQLSDGKMKQVASPGGPFGNIRIAIDGKTVGYIGSRGDGPSPHDLYLQAIDGGPARNLTGSSLDRPINSFTWLEDGTILAHASTGTSSTFYSISKDGQTRKHKDTPVYPQGSFVATSKFLAFIGEKSALAPELWISTVEGKADKITSFNKEWETVPLVQPEIVRYPSFDGTMIEAMLLKPVHYKQETKLPLVVLVHGGPTGVWSERFNAWGQLLAARGFAVLCPNIRGSSGYGHEFMVMNRKDWGGGDFKDIMAGLDFMISRGIADEGRLGIGGWSYGGYMAAWAVTQTNRFKASVSGAPMTDLALEYGAEESSINAYDTWFLGTPYENLDHFIKMSPMTFVKNVKTPTLILCGENDSTDPIAQCFQFHRGLKRYQVETEFVVYPREGHGIREEKHQLDALNRMIAWFDKFLK